MHSGFSPATNLPQGILNLHATDEDKNDNSVASCTTGLMQCVRWRAACPCERARRVNLGRPRTRCR